MNWFRKKDSCKIGDMVFLTDAEIHQEANEIFQGHDYPRALFVETAKWVRAKIFKGAPPNMETLAFMRRLMREMEDADKKMLVAAEKDMRPEDLSPQWKLEPIEFLKRDDLHTFNRQYIERAVVSAVLSLNEKLNARGTL